MAHTSGADMIRMAHARDVGVKFVKRALDNASISCGNILVHGISPLCA